MSKKPAKRGTFARVLRQIRPYWPVVALLLLFAAVSVLCSLYLPVLAGNAIDLLLGPGQVPFDRVLALLLQGAGLIAVSALTQWLMNVCGNHIAYRTIRDLRQDAFAKIHRLPFSYLDSHESGDIVSRIIGDVDQFADGLLMGFYAVLHRRGDHRGHHRLSCSPSTCG